MSEYDLFYNTYKMNWQLKHSREIRYLEFLIAPKAQKQSLYLIQK